MSELTLLFHIMNRKPAICKIMTMRLSKERIEAEIAEYALSQIYEAEPGS